MASDNQTHVHFASDASPPAKRLKKTQPAYPRVAQVKGIADRRSSHDLWWRWDRLSSVQLSHSEYVSVQHNKLSMELVLEEAEDRLKLVAIDTSAEESVRSYRDVLRLLSSMLAKTLSPCQSATQVGAFVSLIAQLRRGWQAVDKSPF